MASLPGAKPLACGAYLSAAHYLIVESADYDTCIRSFGTANLLDHVFQGSGAQADFRKLALFLTYCGSLKNPASSILETAYSYTPLRSVLDEYTRCRKDGYSTLSHASLLKLQPATLDLVVTENSFIAVAYPQMTEHLVVTATALQELSNDPGGLNPGVRSLLTNARGLD
jgi:hypothetical protein